MSRRPRSADHVAEGKEKWGQTHTHTRRDIQHVLQTIKSILRQTREEAVAIVNPADYKAVDWGLGRVKRKRLKRALDPSKLVEAAPNNMIDTWKKP